MGLFVFQSDNCQIRASGILFNPTGFVQEGAFQCSTIELSQSPSHFSC
jgi:hypothetical protein